MILPCFSIGTLVINSFLTAQSYLTSHPIANLSAATKLTSKGTKEHKGNDIHCRPSQKDARWRDYKANYP